MIDIMFVRNLVTNAETVEGCAYLAKDGLVVTERGYFAAASKAVSAGFLPELSVINKIAIHLLMENDDKLHEIGFRLRTTVLIAPVMLFGYFFQLDPEKTKSKEELALLFKQRTMYILRTKLERYRENFFSFDFRRDVSIAFSYINSVCKLNPMLAPMRDAMNWAERIVKEDEEEAEKKAKVKK